MELFVALVVLVGVGMLATPKRVASRDGLGSKEQRVAVWGAAWADRSDRAMPPPSRRIDTVGADPAGADSAPTRAIDAFGGKQRSPQYPTLALIERALDDGAGAFTGSPHAARLERRARELAGEFWGDSVWLTGLVSEAAFNRVRDALEWERIALGRASTVLTDPVPLAVAPVA